MGGTFSPLLSDCSIDSLNNAVARNNQTISDLNTVISNNKQTISAQNAIINTKDEELNQTKSILNEISEQVPMYISDMAIKNEGDNYGDRIYSSNTTYIYPKIDVFSLIEGKVKFYVKFYTPYRLSTSSTPGASPSGYSYSYDTYLCKFQKQTVYINGWGGKTKGHWKSGSYRIEVWYNGRQLYEKAFTIY